MQFIKRFWGIYKTRVIYLIFTADEVEIIIPDEYNRASFQDIDLAYRQLENDASIFQNISSTIAGYMLSHYTLLFPYRNLE